MLIKQVDDRESDLAVLNDLLNKCSADANTRKRIEEEIRNIQAGVAGEREAAYEIDFYYKNSPYYAVIHDLRLEVGDRVAQIDHLIINRYLAIWVCESKHFAQGVGVNEIGEWVSYWRRLAQGIPSPMEQLRKHCLVLNDVFNELLPLPRRVGLVIKPQMRTLVLVSNRARISRPKFQSSHDPVDLDRLIKADQLKSAIGRDVDEMISKLGTVRALASFQTSAWLKAFAEQLAALHRPIEFDWSGRFGIHPIVEQPTQAALTPIVSTAPTTSLCASCGEGVSAKVIAYCFEHSERFQSRVLCYHCQHTVRNPKPPTNRGTDLDEGFLASGQNKLF